MTREFLSKHNIRYIRRFKDSTMITDLTGDSWVVKDNNLYHFDNHNGTYQKNTYHLQKKNVNVKAAILYIGSHTKDKRRVNNFRFTARERRLNNLFEQIKIK